MKNTSYNREAHVLVGFGKHDLIDLIKLIGTKDEMTLYKAPVEWPSRRRRRSICSNEEVEAFRTYLNWITYKLRK
jgi:hypothetical protein